MITKHGEVEGAGIELARIDGGLIAVAAEDHLTLGAQIEAAFELFILSVARYAFFLEEGLHAVHEQHFGIVVDDLRTQTEG